MDREVAPALRALLERSIDYLGALDPAVPLPEVFARYERYRCSEHSWILNRLVLPANCLARVQIDPDWRVSVIAEDPFELTPWTASVETASMAEFGVRTYREIAVARVPEIDCWKVRAGGNAVEGIGQCARRILAFKIDASLSGPLDLIRLLAASMFAWHHRKLDFWHAIFSEGDPEAFRFDEALRWRDHSLTTGQVRAARRDFLHAVSSGSFEDPVNALASLGWL